MNVGFIGVGGIAQPHLNHLDAMDDVSVTVVCDIDEEAAREAAEPRGAAVYTDHEAMYDAEAEALDAVYICVPPFAHTTQELVAAERGLPFLVEKPVALSMETARAVEAAVEGSGIVTQAGYQTRYSPLVERARHLVGDRQVALLDGRNWTGVPGTPWWRVKEKSGGQVVEMATHRFDLVRYFGGEVERVAAYGGHEVVDEIDFEDASCAAMMHETGAVSQVSTTSASPSGSTGIGMVGEGFQLDLDLRADRLAGVVDGDEVAFETDANAQLEADRAFVRAVREDDPGLTRSPYADAVRTLELTLAVDESMETGGEVVLG